VLLSTGRNMGRSLACGSGKTVSKARSAGERNSLRFVLACYTLPPNIRVIPHLPT
jgi:hypothetical protein